MIILWMVLSYFMHRSSLNTKAQEYLTRNDNLHSSKKRYKAIDMERILLKQTVISVESLVIENKEIKREMNGQNE